MGDVEDGGEVLGEDGGEDDYGGKDGNHTNPICFDYLIWFGNSIIPMIPTHTNTYHPIGAPHFRKTFFFVFDKIRGGGG